MNARTCPPCHGDCRQGRDCPLEVIDDQGLTRDFLAMRPTHTGDDAITRRALADNADLRIKNAVLQRQLNYALAGLVASVALATVALTAVPW